MAAAAGRSESGTVGAGCEQPQEAVSEARRATISGKVRDACGLVCGLIKARYSNILFLFPINRGNGGGGGIRTHGREDPTLDFESSPFDHSGTPPRGPELSRSDRWPSTQATTNGPKLALLNDFNTFF